MGANVHDIKKVEDVLLSMPFLPPEPTEEYSQHFCADKGYDSKSVRLLIEESGYEEHIESRWQEKEKKKEPHYRARRWDANGRTHG